MGADVRPLGAPESTSGFIVPARPAGSVADPTATDSSPPPRGPESDKIDRLVAADLEDSSLLVTLLAGVLLFVTAVVAVVPGLAMGVYFSAQATPLVPPAWSSLYPGVNAASAGGSAIAIALTVGMLLLVGGALALAYRGLRRLRADSLSRSEKERLSIQRATYLFGGVVAAAVLFVVWILVAFGIAVSTLPSSATSSTPASFVSGAQVGLAILGGVLAMSFLLGAVLLVMFHRAVRFVVTKGSASPLSLDASVLIPFGAALYFAVVLTPYVDSSSFSTVLYIVGGTNGPWVWLTLPCWLFVTAGFLLLLRDWYGIRTGPSLSQDKVDTVSRADSSRRRRPTRGAVTAVAVAFVVTLGIFAAPSLGSSYGVVAHTVCVGGTVLAKETRWTPMVIVNSPYGGNATGSWTQIDPDGAGWDQWTISASNGSTNLEATVNNWTVYAAHTELLAGPGGDAPCQSPYLAVASGGPLGILVTNLTSSTPFSDRNLPHEFNATFFTPTLRGNVSSVFFSAGYGDYPNATYSSCPGVARFYWTESSESVRVSVPFELNGVNELATATLYSLTNYTYTSSVPGTYNVEDLGIQASGFGSGLAFSYTPC